jgi:hypothetical protein
MSHQDGHCATPGETIYVKNDTSVCVTVVAPGDPGSGTLAKPLCAMDPVPTLLSTSRTLVLVRGTVMSGSWSIMGQASEISLIGQQSALVGSVTSPALSLQNGPVYARDLEFSSSGSIGISATGGTLRLHHVTIDNCKQGGLLLMGTAFDISDTTVADNNHSTDLSWGGMFIQNPPSSGPVQLSLVTVTNNKGPGINCTATIQGTGVYASGNSTAEIADACGITSCPSLDATCGAQ